MPATLTAAWPADPVEMKTAVQADAHADAGTSAPAPDSVGRTVRPSAAPTVSVVIPAYKAAETIGRAIDSVLAQTFPASEILVIDDGSPDDLAAAVARYGDRVKLVRQANGGASSARNRGLDLAAGDLVALLDADDQWTPDKLARCVEQFERRPSVGMVASRYQLQDSTGRQVRTAGPTAARCGRPLRAAPRELLDVAREISTTTVVVRRELLSERRFDTSLATAEDRDLWLRLLLATEVVLLADSLAIVHERPDSLSHGNLDLDCACMLQVIDRYAPQLGPRIARRERAYVHYKWAAGAGAGAAAWRHWWSSVRLWPRPFALQRTRVRFARPRTLLALVRRDGLRRVWRAICNG